MVTKKKSAFQELSKNTLFQKIGEICSVVNTTSKSDELLKISLSETLSLFGAKRGSIYILEDNGEHLNLKVAQGLKSTEEKNMTKRIGEGVVGKIAQLKKPVYVDDISKDNRFGKLKSMAGYRTPSFICAPLMIKDQLIGVINITDKVSGHHFNKEEMQLLDFLSGQIALNYKRIQLYNKFKSVTEEKEDLKNRLGETDKERKHLKKQIVIQEKLASIGRLAGGIAHEFNNPLDGVLRYTNLCLTHVKEEDVIRDYLLEIKQGLNRMVNIVRNLLACSRNDALADQTISLEDAINHALESVQNDLVQKNIKIDKKFGASLFPIQDLGLERVFSNIIRNSVDAMSKNGSLRIQVHNKNEFLVTKISDTGCGIPTENIDLIFEPFFTTKDLNKGCGLGLTIVGEIIKSYDGTIDVESNLNKGTTFTISLPIK